MLHSQLKEYSCFLKVIYSQYCMIAALMGQFNPAVSFELWLIALIELWSSYFSLEGTPLLVSWFLSRIRLHTVWVSRRQNHGCGRYKVNSWVPVYAIQTTAPCVCPSNPTTRDLMWTSFQNPHGLLLSWTNTTSPTSTGVVSFFLQLWQWASLDPNKYSARQRFRKSLRIHVR